MSGKTHELPPIDDDDLPPPRRPAQDEIDDIHSQDHEIRNSISSASTTAIPPPMRPAPPTSQYQPSIGSYQSGGTMSYGQSQNQPAISAAQAEIDKRIVNHAIKIQEEHWLKSYWRPAMGWLYMVICFVDFVLFPAMAMFLPALLKGFGVAMQYTPWQSLSLSNGGLVHVAFGAILGVAAWSRGQEKMTGSR